MTQFKLELTKKEFEFLHNWLAEDYHLEAEKEVNDSLNPRSPIVLININAKKRR